MSRVPEQVALDPLPPGQTLYDFPARLPEPRQVLDRIGHAHGREPRLAAAEKVPGTAGLQVLLRDDEAVMGCLENREPAAGFLSGAGPDDQGAPGRSRASAGYLRALCAR